MFTTEQALAAAHDVGYPVLVRPSRAGAARGMEIAQRPQHHRVHAHLINQVGGALLSWWTVPHGPRGEGVDGVFDGEELLIPGIMEHIERAGVHSGDSSRSIPHPIHIEDRHKQQTILEVHLP